MVVYCSDDCKEFPCCDFCIWAKHEEWDEDGRHIFGGPIGCNLHLDEEHQEIADSCGCCEDYWCFRAKDKLINAGKLAESILHYAPLNYKWFIHEIDKAVQKDKWIIADDGDGIICPYCDVDFCNLIHETKHFHYCPNCGKKVID